MQELILDSTWSYRVKTLVWLKGRETAISCYTAKMKPYTDNAIKADYKATMDACRKALRHETDVILIGTQAFRSAEIQAVNIKIDLLNDLNRGKSQNDFAPMLGDILADWYQAECLDD